MNGPAIAIECRDIGLTFAGASGEPTVALSGVSCRFLPGKVTAIIGPSGCGKSTLLQIARGFLEPTLGQLDFVRLENGAAAKRPAMSTVWQAFNLFPWLTVIENVAFGLELAGVPKAEREARAREGDRGGRPLRLRRPSIRASFPAACGSVSGLHARW